MDHRRRQQRRRKYRGRTLSLSVLGMHTLSELLTCWLVGAVLKEQQQHHRWITQSSFGSTGVELRCIQLPFLRLSIVWPVMLSSELSL